MDVLKTRMDVLKTWFSPDTRIGFPAQRKSDIKPQAISSKQYVARLVLLFCSWKLLLLAVVYFAPGPGYDTSTAIFFDQHGVQAHSWLSRVVQDATLRLTRWDAFYFTSASYLDEHAYEQSWAFSWTLSKFTNLLSNLIPVFLHHSLLVRHALAGIALSHISHLGAVITLYFLTFELLPTQPERKRQIAFTAACLHIISPAGIFLSAAYGEAAFAFLTFLGIYCHTLALRIYLSPGRERRPHIYVFFYAATSVALAVAATIRSNGLLNGIPILLDFLSTLHTTLTENNSINNKNRNRAHLTGLLFTGLSTLLGFLAPQALAYTTYCLDTPTPRPWCTALPPSIYTFVQKHYWNVTPFAYWNLSNLPLFALAAPLLLLLTHTAWSALHHAPALHLALPSELTPTQRTNPTHQSESRLFTLTIHRLALTQLLLATLALTTFHVQIILRIASGLPLWYVVLAIAIHAPEKAGCGHGLGEHYFPFSGVMGGRGVEAWVRGMAGWAVLQAGLFGAFLPPA